jgi:hypothetical protein
MKEVAQNACHRLQCKLQHDVFKKAELVSKCFCFDEFPERHFELSQQGVFEDEVFLLTCMRCSKEF